MVSLERRDWAMYNMAQTSEKQLAMSILNNAVDSMDLPLISISVGRPGMLLDTMLKSCVIKVFNLSSSRRTMPDIEYVYRMGYLSEKPHFNTISKYMRTHMLRPFIHQLYKTLAIPLKDIEYGFSADSTGFGTMRKVWMESKMKPKRMSDFKKLHIMSGNMTNIITAAKVTGGHANDAPHFAELLANTSNNFNIGDVCADAGYLSRQNCDAVESFGGVPYIMPKHNVRSLSRGSIAWKHMIELFIDNEVLFRQHYHKRSNVESTFSSIKRKFLPYLRSKSVGGQYNELLCKVVCHNLGVLISAIFELGIKPKF